MSPWHRHGGGQGVPKRRRIRAPAPGQGGVEWSKAKVTPSPRRPTSPPPPQISSHPAGFGHRSLGCPQATLGSPSPQDEAAVPGSGVPPPVPFALPALAVASRLPGEGHEGHEGHAALPSSPPLWRRRTGTRPHTCPPPRTPRAGVPKSPVPTRGPRSESRTGAGVKLQLLWHFLQGSHSAQSEPRTATHPVLGCSARPALGCTQFFWGAALTRPQGAATPPGLGCSNAPGSAGQRGTQIWGVCIQFWGERASSFGVQRCIQLSMQHYTRIWGEHAPSFGV